MKDALVAWRLQVIALLAAGSTPQAVANKLNVGVHAILRVQSWGDRIRRRAAALRDLEEQLAAVQIGPKAKKSRRSKNKPLRRECACKRSN